MRTGHHEAEERTGDRWCDVLLTPVILQKRFRVLREEDRLTLAFLNHLVNLSFFDCHFLELYATVYAVKAYQRATLAQSAAVSFRAFVSLKINWELDASLMICLHRDFLDISANRV